MWELKRYAEFEQRLKKVIKHNRNEVTNALANLNSYFESLNLGLKPPQIIRGYVHSEPKGIAALDQSGPLKTSKVIRLYVYADEDTQILHILTLGDKGSQSDDIKNCKATVDKLLQSNTKKGQDSNDDKTNQ